jgi:hypothetical protein
MPLRARVSVPAQPVTIVSTLNDLEIGQPLSGADDVMEDTPKPPAAITSGSTS